MSEVANGQLILDGGCLCGAVRYRATGKPYDVSHCHCSMCRRASGAPFVSWFTVPATGLQWVQGAPAQYRSSAKATRGFCHSCGTALTFQRVDLLREIDVTICSLDHPGLLTPQDHLWVKSRLPWIKCQDGLPEFEAQRSSSQPRFSGES